MSKRKTVVRACPEPLSNVVPADLDWKSCCFCQTGSNTPLVCPAENPVENLRNKGYNTICANLTQLEDFDFKLPSGRPLHVLNQGDGIESCFIRNKAKWHRACAVKFRSPRFENLLKALQKTANKSDCPAQTESNQKTTACPTTRLRSPPPVAMKDFKCFLCMGPETRKHPLTLCATKEITERVKQCATVLNDLRLIGMLKTGGDLVAMEAKYHKQCLSQLYNKFNSQLGNSSDNESKDFCDKIAFAELVLYIENKLSSDIQYVFDMGTISKTYHSRIAQLKNVSEPEISMTHTTRLREKILNYFPTLIDDKWGKRYVLKSRTANFLPNVYREDQEDDVLAYHRFAKAVRKSISERKVSFEGEFPDNCEEKCIPGPLLAAVTTLLYGSTPKDYSGARSPALAICELIMLNFREAVPKGDIVRHKKDREPPLPLYMALSSYGRSRDKQLIDRMHQRGLSVSSNRVTEVTSQLCRLVVQRARDEKVVCPSILKNNIFTVAALDNIDFKSTSNTTAIEFHGTGISVFQCPTRENAGQSREFLTSFNDVCRNGDRSVPNLPDFYANVPDCILPTEKPPPVSNEVDVGILEMLSAGAMSSQWNSEEPWLRSFKEHFSDQSENRDFNFSWASFHATLEKEKLDGKRISSISSLLPLFHEKSTSIGMIKHGMRVVRDLTQHLNNNQVPVICFDQQLYTIAKKIQWSFPEEFGNKKFVLLLGPLHIEQSFLRVLGNFLEECGLTAILAHSGVCSAGSADALLKVTHIKRSRELHQLIAAVLYSLALDEYERWNPDETVPFGTWLQEKAHESPTIKFWLTVLNLEITLLTFVRAVRLGDFEQFKESLKLMVPWYFVFDHQNYSRWLPVHISDLEQLEHNAPHVQAEFQQGHFVVHKTSNLFSGLGIDHAHEQNNAIVKGKGGAVGLTNDPYSLKRWTIGGPEVSRLLSEFEGCSDDNDDFGYHHEQKESYQVRFLEHTIALKDAFLEYDNPFAIDGPELITLDTRAAVSDEAIAVLKNIENKGLSLYTNFVNERLLNKTRSIYDPIQKCQTNIFGMKKKNVRTTPLKTLKADFELFSRSFIVSVGRSLDLDQFFAHENQEFPPSLSLNGEMRTGDKNELTVILEKKIPFKDAEERFSTLDGVIIDGAVMVHAVRPRPDIKTFTEYASQIEAYIWSSFVHNYGVKRVDIAWDLYLPNSLKQATRSGRGAGVRRVNLPAKDKLPSDWADYLRNDMNKEELFNFMSRTLLHKFRDIEFVTNVRSTIEGTPCAKTSLSGVSCLTMEEADGRLVLHLKDAVENAGLENVAVRSSDTDVLVLLVSFYPSLRQKGLKQLWLQFGVGSKRRYISIHRIVEALGDEKSIALRGFHAFSGCDLTSFFCGKGKRTAFSAWDSTFDSAFKEISSPQNELSPRVFAALENFVIRMYCGSSASEVGPENVNQARKEIFASKTKYPSQLPASQAALQEHIRRAAYVAGHIWGSACRLEGTTTSPEGWGWTLVGNEWQVVWTKLDPVWKAVRALDRCGCGSQCDTLRCLCRRLGLPCTPACKKCMGNCANKGGETTSNADDNDDLLGDP